MKSSKSLAQTALLSALALICGYIESLIPASFVIPGVKLGISNVIILFAIYSINIRTAFFVMLIKVTASAMLFSGLNVILYSFGGGIFSLFIMSILKKLGFSPITSGMLGGAFHNFGQLSAAALMMKTLSVFYNLPFFAISGMFFGLATGALSKIVIERMKNI